MKKNYFLLAATTMMFAACAQTDMVNEVVTEEAPQAIGFETFANKQTRNSASTVLEDYHKTFGVWAFKTPSGGTESTVMPNYQVMNDDNGTGSKDWDYDGTNKPTGQVLKYWDKLASYKFYAYAPYAATGVSIDNTTKYISIAAGEYAANENLQAGNWGTGLNNKVFETSTDWMIATTVSRAAGECDLVNEVFSHTMSKLVVAIQSSIANTIVKSVSINNVHGTGSYTTQTSKWTTTGTAKSISGVTGTIASQNTPYYSMEYLLIPSQDDPTLSIEYEINGDTYTVTNAAITPITAFEENYSYTLTVKIGLDPIEFDATVNPFSAPDPAPGVTIE